MYTTLYIRPKTNEKISPEKIRTLIKYLSHLDPDKTTPFMIGFVTTDIKLDFIVSISNQFAQAAENTILSILPSALVEIGEYPFAHKQSFKSTPITQKKDQLIPFNTDAYLSDDIINFLLRNMASADISGSLALEVWILPVGETLKEQVNYSTSLIKNSINPQETKTLIADKKEMDKIYSSIRLIHETPLTDTFVEQFKTYLKKLSKKDGNKLVLTETSISTSYQQISKPTSIFSLEEVMGIIHLPSMISNKSFLNANNVSDIPVPTEVTKAAINPNTNRFGYNQYGGKTSIIGIPEEDRNNHVYIIGKTGTGKTKLLELLIRGDIDRNRCVIYLDPHGDTARNITRYIPQNRIKDTIYADFTNDSFIFGFNPLANSSHNNEILIQNFTEVFKKFFSQEWDAKIEFLIRQVLSALTYHKGASIADIPRILNDPKFRNELVPKISDDVVKNFWAIEYMRFSAGEGGRAVSLLQNKISQLLTNKKIRRVFTVPQSTFDIKDVIENQKILIVNISIGELGEWNSSFIGSMIVSEVLRIMFGQSSIQEKDRKQVYMYVDEFQNMATDGFIRILSEARKYKLGLTVAHQYLDQLPPEILKAITGNIGSIISFRVGQNDSKLLLNEFGKNISEEDFVYLNNREFISKISINGKTSSVFKGRTLFLDEPKFDSYRDVTNNSVSNYAMNKNEVDQITKGKISLLPTEETNSFPAPVT